MVFILLSVLLFFCLKSPVHSVDNETFKNCSQTFCSELRNIVLEEDDYYEAHYYMDSGNQIFLYLTNKNGGPDLKLVITELGLGLSYSIFRIEIDDPIKPRYKLEQVLLDTILHSKPASKRNYRIQESQWGLKIINDNVSNGWEISITYGPPFLLDTYVYVNDEWINQMTIDGGKFTWQSNSTRFAIDIDFPNSQVLYGLFHHADSLALKDTADGTTDPYRLRNLDTFQYEINSTMALSGSIPVIYGHSTNTTAGLFLHNAAEQWIDVSYKNPTSIRFMVDTGAFDMFIFFEPDPPGVLQQYEYLTGVAHMPQLWTLGYHQSRRTYWTQNDILDVVENMDEYDFPVDVIWLDEGYSKGYRYLEWNSENYSDPIGLQEKINETNRKLGLVANPHIKVDDDYLVYSQAKAKGLFVKYSNQSDYEGTCLPGLSSYLDFLNDETIEFYANLFSYENFVNQTSVIAAIWNDLNEPTVFDNSSERTIPSDLQHYPIIEHKNVHNIYGLQQTKATHLGMLRRDNGNTRPFVLSRSTFAGFQRYAAMLTGDNSATWDDLAITFSECLTANILGQVWCGANVGAFYLVSDDELAFRWYQSAAWLPFYRGHSDGRLDPETPRREPYVYPENIRNLIRSALRTRYSHIIPQWYRLFYEHTRNGDPVIRPLFYQYPKDEQVFTIDQQLLLGSDILVRHVTEPNATSVNMYVPGSNQYWYRANDNTLHLGGQWQNVQVNETFIPVYYRAGSIIVRKNIPRPTTKDMENDPYDLYVYLNQSQTANGTLYFDDYTSFGYRDNNEYGYYLLEYDGAIDQLTITAIDEFARPPGTAHVGSLTIYRFPEDSTQLPVYEVYNHTAQGIQLKNIDIVTEVKNVNKFILKL